MKDLRRKKFENDIIIFKNHIKRDEYVAQFCMHHPKIIIMPLLTILLVLVVVGVALWLINTYIPMDRKIKNLLNIVVVIVVVIWLLKAFGLLDSLKSLRI